MLSCGNEPWTVQMKERMGMWAAEMELLTCVKVCSKIDGDVWKFSHEARNKSADERSFSLD
jgi:hypothetical protein